jgi:hypothetical protein
MVNSENNSSGFYMNVLEHFSSRNQVDNQSMTLKRVENGEMHIYTDINVNALNILQDYLV